MEESTYEYVDAEEFDLRDDEIIRSVRLAKFDIVGLMSDVRETVLEAVKKSQRNTTFKHFSHANGWTMITLRTALRSVLAFSLQNELDVPTLIVKERIHTVRSKPYGPEYLFSFVEKSRESVRKVLCDHALLESILLGYEKNDDQFEIVFRW